MGGGLALLVFDKQGKLCLFLEGSFSFVESDLRFCRHTWLMLRASACVQTFAGSIARTSAGPCSRTANNVLKVCKHALGCKTIPRLAIEAMAVQLILTALVIILFSLAAFLLAGAFSNRVRTAIRRRIPYLHYEQDMLLLWGLLSLAIVAFGLVVGYLVTRP